MAQKEQLAIDSSVSWESLRCVYGLLLKDQLLYTIYQFYMRCIAFLQMHTFLNLFRVLFPSVCVCD